MGVIFGQIHSMNQVGNIVMQKDTMHSRPPVHKYQARWVTSWLTICIKSSEKRRILFRGDA